MLLSWLSWLPDQNRQKVWIKRGFSYDPIVPRPLWSLEPETFAKGLPLFSSSLSKLPDQRKKRGLKKRGV